MIKINYPDKKPLIKSEGTKELIFCIIRKRWFNITPEEWVRQNFLLFLTEVLKYPSSLIAVEKQVIIGELKKRFDIVIYKNDVPHMLVECKELNVSLSENVFLQLNRYNTHMQATYLIVTNGSHCIGFEKINDSFLALKEFPVYS